MNANETKIVPTQLQRRFDLDVDWNEGARMKTIAFAMVPEDFTRPEYLTLKAFAEAIQKMCVDGAHEWNGKPLYFRVTYTGERVNIRDKKIEEVLQRLWPLEENLAIQTGFFEQNAVQMMVTMAYKSRKPASKTAECATAA